MSLKTLFGNQYTLPLIILLVSMIFWSYIIDKVNTDNINSNITPTTTSNSEETEDPIIKVVEQPPLPVVKEVEKRQVAEKKEIEEKAPNKPQVSQTATAVTSENTSDDNSANELNIVEKIIEKKILSQPSNIIKVKKETPVDSSFAPLKPAVTFTDDLEQKIEKKKEETITSGVEKVMPTIKDAFDGEKQIDKIVASLKKSTIQEKVVKNGIINSGNRKVKEENVSNKSGEIASLQEKIKSLTSRLMKAEKKTSANPVSTKNTTKQNNVEYVISLKNQNKVTTLIKAEKEKVDYYNRIQLGQSNITSSLQDKINKLGSDSSSSKYVKSLKAESLVRRNQVRSIELKKGESIWKIAVRAYGNGNLYIKILKANPQITVENARYLQPGIFIRVPI